MRAGQQACCFAGHEVRLSLHVVPALVPVLHWWSRQSMHTLLAVASPDSDSFLPAGQETSFNVQDVTEEVPTLHRPLPHVVHVLSAWTFPDAV